MEDRPEVTRHLKQTPGEGKAEGKRRRAEKAKVKVGAKEQREKGNVAAKKPKPSMGTDGIMA